jgi:hypothetical protein
MISSTWPRAISSERVRAKPFQISVLYVVCFDDLHHVQHLAMLHASIANKNPRTNPLARRIRC